MVVIFGGFVVVDLLILTNHFGKAVMLTNFLFLALFVVVIMKFNNEVKN